jgi:glycerol-3-phosphate dehydrogenase
MAEGFAAFHAELARRYPFLSPLLLRHYARRYGTRAFALLDGVRGEGDLGCHFGGHFYAREAEFLIATEWAESAEDILERRTKHALFLTPAERAAFEAWLAAR